jgi:hypothetical protein
MSEQITEALPQMSIRPELWLSGPSEQSLGGSASRDELASKEMTRDL